jgi:aminopeptidase N
MIGVIIHEVGHNFFPMIINSDERQHTWMDEGLNTFVQFLTEQEWDYDYPSRRGPAAKIVPYMQSPKDTQRPIMTNSEQVLQFGNNAYGKPATALNILRETVMGRELFDFAFKTYSERWAFKHPTPEDFFRTMEDASGVDLDWFWRGWFYTTDHVDQAITNVETFTMDTKDPEVRYALAKELHNRYANHIARQRNMEINLSTRVNENEELKDFYNSYEPFEITDQERADYKAFMESLTDEEKAFFDANYTFYQVTFENEGGLVMPVIIEWTYTDGTSEVQYIPAEIWRKNENMAVKIFAKTKEVKSIVLDPFLETADVDESNNYWPSYNRPSRFELYRRSNRPRGSGGRSNPMQQARQSN